MKFFPELATEFDSMTDNELEGIVSNCFILSFYCASWPLTPMDGRNCLVVVGMRANQIDIGTSDGFSSNWVFH